MRRIALFIVISLTSNSCVNYHNFQEIKNCNSTTILLTEKAQGIGPGGNNSYSFGSIDMLDSTVIEAFLQTKNLPDSLTSMKRYCMILDEYQFYYQNYRNGSYSKEDFLKKIKTEEWNIDDTTNLSDKILKTTISVVSGYNSKKMGVYVVDANNNSDFSDDTLRSLFYDLYAMENILDNSYYVDYEFYDGKSIRKDKKLLNVKTFNDNQTGYDIYFSFPEFLYSKIKYGDKVYLICQETYNNDKAIYVMEDIPYFSVSFNYKVKPNQYIRFGDDFYLYKPTSIPGTIKIINAKISNDEYNEQITQNSMGNYRRNPIPVSNQFGMIAPEIKGVDILTDSLVSLRKNSGKYVFLDFWSTYCIPCIMDFPNLIKVYEEFDRSNVEIIGIVDDRTNGNIKQFIKDKNVIWPNINMTALTTDISGYEINSYPTSYLIDPDGKIIATDLRGDQLLKRLESLITKNN